MSNVTRADIRRFLETMDRLAEPDAVSRLDQARMLAACAVPDELVRVIAKVGAQGRVTMEDLNQIAGMGYSLPRPQPGHPSLHGDTRAEVVDALTRGLPSLPLGVGGGIHVHVDDLQHALRRAFDIGRIT